ncbi:histidine phosphatase superfamily, partial [Baffinella frigidus]
VEIWVVRHGETVENTTRTIAGQNASGLTPRGVKQAVLVAKRLQGIHFSAIYISDLSRTKQTADPIIR